jgi:hypothetical protein
MTTDQLLISDPSFQEDCCLFLRSLATKDNCPQMLTFGAIDAIIRSLEQGNILNRDAQEAGISALMLLVQTNGPNF